MLELLTSTERCPRRHSHASEPRAIPYVATLAHPRCGFTLIEMLIVLSILAIAAAIAGPRLNVLLGHQKVDRATQIVASDIRAAFTSAARGRVPVHVNFVFANRSYAITNRVTGDTIILRDMSTGDLGVASLNGSNAALDVFPSGIATSYDTISIGGAATYVRRVAVSRIGAVTVLP